MKGTVRHTTGESLGQFINDEIKSPTMQICRLVPLKNTGFE